MRPYPYVAERAGQQRNGVSVIDYRLEGVADAGQATACALAARYHERWKIETAQDELKTYLRGTKIILRNNMPDLVAQEFYGLEMAHFAEGEFHARSRVISSRERRNSRGVKRKMSNFSLRHLHAKTSPVARRRKSNQNH